MTIEMLTHPADQTTDTHMLNLDEVVETIRDDALDRARRKMNIPQSHADLGALLNRSDFLDYFKHGLASGVVDVLAANDANVQAAYTYDPSLNPDSETGADLPVDPGVHLLVQVQLPSAALAAFVAALDRALTAGLKQLPGDRFAQRESILDVNLVTEEDVRLGTGYAGLLRGVFAPPIKVWQRV